MSPKVTVAIPTYSNRVDYLRESVGSILAQTMGDLEVFVSNDGSTDGTTHIVDHFGDPRLHYVELPRPGGLHANLNACLRLGTAPYVAICQDDDYWLPTNLERLVKVLDEQEEVVMAHAAFRWVDQDDRILRDWSAWEGYRGDVVETGEEFIWRSMAAINRVNMSSALLRRGALSDASFREADGVLCDTGMWLRTARHGSVAFVSEPLTALRIHADSASVSTGINDSMRGATLLEIELAQQAKERFLREYGYAASESRRHLLVARRWVKGELLRVVTRLSGPGRSPFATAALLARAVRLEPSLAVSPRAWRVLMASLAGRRLREAVGRRRDRRTA